MDDPEEQDPQLTLVAFLGDKPGPLARLLRDCQERIGAALGPVYEPYALEQIHATIVGLEHVAGGRRDNRNMKRLRGRRAAMDIEGFLATLVDDPALPLAVRFGGFAKGERSPVSRGRPPWERTFSIQSDKAVLIGWPVLPTLDRYPATIAGLRRRAETFDILHAYHGSPEDADNDIYLRLGIVSGGQLRPRGSATGSPDDACAILETTLRDSLASRPVTVPLAMDDLRVAVYRDPALPPATTRAIDPLALCEPGATDSL